MINVQRGKKCHTCGQYYERHVVVEGVVLRGNKVLLIKRGIEPMKGSWALPGGYLDWNETVEEGMVREVREETGVIATIRTLVGVYSLPDRSLNDAQNVGCVFILDVVDESFMMVQGEEVEEVKWFDVSAIPQLAFDHAKIIQDVVSLTK